MRKQYQVHPIMRRSDLSWVLAIYDEENILLINLKQYQKLRPRFASTWDGNAGFPIYLVDKVGTTWNYSEFSPTWNEFTKEELQLFLEASFFQGDFNKFPWNEYSEFFVHFRFHTGYGTHFDKQFRG